MKFYIWMKFILVLLIMLFVFGTAEAFDSDAWVSLQYYHPHNEYTVAPRDVKTGHARYGFEVYFELGHRGWFGFIDTLSLGGRNIPQKLYTFDADYIATYLRYGGGYRFNERYEIALIHGRWVGNVRERLQWNALQFKVTFW